MIARSSWLPLLAFAVLAVTSPAARAQTTPEEAGFKAIAASEATGEEISRQRNLWVMEVRLKPVRLVNVDVTDPKTGEKKKTLVWYVVYQAINRPITRRDDVRDTVPVNVVDPPPGPAMFVPEFTIVATDSEAAVVYEDEVIPEALAAIRKREKKPYLSTAEVIGPIPTETPLGSTNEQVVEGVATFRGIDPATDYFTLFASGFTNGYALAGPPPTPEEAPLVLLDEDGKPIAWRKTIAQRFWRPGDEFNQNEGEFRLRGNPVWTYRPDRAETPAADPAEPDADDEAAEAGE